MVERILAETSLQISKFPKWDKDQNFCSQVLKVCFCRNVSSNIQSCEMCLFKDLVKKLFKSLKMFVFSQKCHFIYQNLPNVFVQRLWLFPYLMLSILNNVKNIRRELPQILKNKLVEQIWKMESVREIHENTVELRRINVRGGDNLLR